MLTEVDPNADSYQQDYYEQPTIQTYESVNGHWASMSNDVNGSGGLLLVADQPELKNSPNTSWGQVGTFGYHDTNGDVGGTGLSVTKSDNYSEVSGNGFDDPVIADGVRSSDSEDVLWTRLDPNDSSIVEFAFNYGAFGYTQDDPMWLAYLEFEAIKGGPKDNQNYLWNDEYTLGEAGSPYQIESSNGLQNIYELETLRGANPVPLPPAILLFGSGLAMFAGIGRRMRKSKD